jgi:hypothetical protein
MMFALIVFLWSMATTARADALLVEPWSLSNISLTIVDYSTPRENMQMGFHLDYPNRPPPGYDDRCYAVPSMGLMKQWRQCPNEQHFRIRTTNVVVADAVEVDFHAMKYSWTK